MPHKTPEYIKELAKKWLNRTISEQEKEYFNNWYNQHDFSQATITGKSKQTPEQVKKRILSKLHQSIAKEKQQSGLRIKHLWIKTGVAASLLIVLALGLHFYQQHTNEELAAVESHEIKPGGNHAILTLSKGETIILDDAKLGLISTQSGISIKKVKDGTLVFDLSNLDQSADDELAYNTISTPKGGQYQVILMDGTKVWLNAASSLEFPTAFKGTERKVKITGEVYFEVAHNMQMPFKVASNNQLVEVLGTHFNINNYTDEDAARTTLLEGKIRISNLSSDAEGRILYPGEQAIIKQGNQTIQIRDTDTEAAVAWKNGFFQFKRADIKTVMRQLSRWYDVDVAYEGTVPSKVFSGDIHRNVNLSQALEILSFYQVNFKVKGKTIVVSQ